ncbi:MAG: FHA domain-containing protein [Gammaproteobacteria bacterium]|nr:FHA domain-containing protein [Gammaproteobacteria bacterium]
MEANSISAGNKAFGAHADSVPVIPYQSHQDALRFLFSATERKSGLALMQGPAGAGKTTILDAFVEASVRDAAVAIVDGVHLTPRNLLNEMLAQFKLDVQTEQDELLMQSLSNFLAHQTRDNCAPILIVDNIDRATKSTLLLLNWLAALEIGGKFIVRIVLTGRDRIVEVIRDQGMRSVARRHPPMFSLNPLTAYEAMTYLRARLIASGGEKANNVFTPDVSYRLHELTYGWPGPLNSAALDIMERAGELAFSKPVPQIILTRNAKTLARYDLTGTRYVIGRSELADIVIQDAFVSKLHAMLQIHNDSIILMDLNSTNGTTVNSRKAQITVLHNNDILMLGSYRLKLENAPASKRGADSQVAASDTVTMKTLTDHRRELARSTIAAIKKESGANRRR